MATIPRIFRHCAKYSIHSIPARLYSEPKGKCFSPGWTVSGVRAAGKQEKQPALLRWAQTTEPHTKQCGT